MVWRETEEANLATSLSKNTGNLQLNPIIELLDDQRGLKNLFFTTWNDNNSYLQMRIILI